MGVPPYRRRLHLQIGQALAQTLPGPRVEDRELVAAGGRFPIQPSAKNDPNPGNADPICLFMNEGGGPSKDFHD